MRTGTLVVATTAAGIVGGIVGALLFLLFFAEDFRPKAAPAPAAAPAEREFSREEAAALRRLPRRVEEMESGLAALARERRAPAPPPLSRSSGSPGSPATPSAPEDEIQRNERAAIATLRNLASCQAQIQTSGKIDCDSDGIGEYGTLQEMTGTVGVRKDGSWLNRGNVVSPPVLSPSLASVDAEGRASRGGYHFQVFLPDTDSPCRFTHETSGGGFAAGTRVVAVDFSETTWCAYAWPVERGRSGNRAFFVNQYGDVLQSRNEVARHSGTGYLDPASAFKGGGITGRVAVGTSGQDGDIWKVTN